MFVHGEEAYHEAIATTEKLFVNASATADSLSIEDLEKMEGVTKFSFDKNKLATGVDVIGFLADTTIFPSKGEARKMVQERRCKHKPEESRKYADDN